MKTGAGRKRKVSWIKSEELEPIEKDLPSLLQDPRQWRSLCYSFGSFHIDRLTCDLNGGTCVMLTRYSCVTPGWLTTDRHKSPAMVEKILAGRVSVGICRPKPQKKNGCYSHLCTWEAGPDSIITVRNGTRLSFRIETDEAFSVLIIRDPYVVDQPSLTPDQFTDLLSRFRRFYPVK